ncbi:hypothetical protein [Streptomyces monomycini]|uniref:hypothetical protein n=1 Tax=Streptomyces monomycini TaxID=371720 RepID=UPI0004AAD1C8
MSTTALTSRVRVLGIPGHRFDETLTPAALDVVGHLATAFTARHREMLTERRRLAHLRQHHRRAAEPAGRHRRHDVSAGPGGGEHRPGGQLATIVARPRGRHTVDAYAQYLVRGTQTPG